MDAYAHSEREEGGRKIRDKQNEIYQELIENEVLLNEHPARSTKQRVYFRVRSQRRLFSDKKRFDELKPRNEKDLERLKDLDFSLKYVDMGNACYTDNHFSDII